MSTKLKTILFLPIAILLLIVAYSTLPEAATNKEESNFFWTSKTFDNQAHKFILGGDSRVYRGIDPLSFDARFNANFTSFNYGYSSAGFSAEYLAFIEEKAVLPTAVYVLGITPNSFTPKALLNEDLNSYLSLSEIEKWKNLHLSKYLKTVAPYGLKEISNLLLNKNAKQKFFNTYYLNGWVKSSALVQDEDYAIKRYAINFTANTADQAAISSFFAWTKKQVALGKPVVGFRPPTCLQMEQLEDSLSGFSYPEFISKFEQSGGIWLNFSSEGYQSYDGSHLHYESAIELSKNLADSLKNRLYKE